MKILEKPDIEKVMERYIIKEGPASGLVHQIDADTLLVELVSAKYKAEVGNTIEDISNLDVARIDEIYRECLHILSDKIWTGKLYPSDPKKADSKLLPCTTDPRHGINYRDTIAKDVVTRLVQKFSPSSPTLEHKSDKVAFLTALSQLFPNVVNPAQTAHSVRAVIENIHNSCGTPSAVFTQKALWLVSYKNGGTGKSYFLQQFGKACDELGIDFAYKTFRQATWVSPSIGLHTVVISEDTPKLATDTAELLNNLIDRSYFEWNVKHGSTGNSKSFANMVMASNYAPYENNSRRYAIVEYLQDNLDFVSVEEKARYIPFWNKPDKMCDAIKTLFLTCPFACELDNGRFTELVQKADASIPIAPKFETILQKVHDTLDYRESLHLDTPPSRPTAFCKLIHEALDIPSCERKDVQAALVNMIDSLRSERKIKEGGRTKTLVHPFDWNQFKSFSIGTLDENESKNTLGSVAVAWKTLINLNSK